MIKIKYAKYATPQLNILRKSSSHITLILVINLLRKSSSHITLILVINFPNLKYGKKIFGLLTKKMPIKKRNSNIPPIIEELSLVPKRKLVL